MRSEEIQGSLHCATNGEAVRRFGRDDVVDNWCGLEVEELAEALGLGAADRDLGLLGVVHAQLVGGLEPGHDLADVLNVDQKGAVGAPEGLGIELVGELFEGAAVGLALDGGGDDGDGALVDGGETDLALIDQEQTVLGADDDLAGGGGWAGWL